MYRESYYYYFTAQHKCEKLMIEVQAEGLPVLSINKQESKIGNLELIRLKISYKMSPKKAVKSWYKQKIEHHLVVESSMVEVNY